MASGPETRTAQAARQAAAAAVPPAPAPPEPTLADFAAQLASLQLTVASQAAAMASQATALPAQAAEMATLKQDHAIEFDDMQQQLGSRRRRYADTDEEHEHDDPVLYTPHFRAENPFHPRPTTVSLAPQV